MHQDNAALCVPSAYANNFRSYKVGCLSNTSLFGIVCAGKSLTVLFTGDRD